MINTFILCFSGKAGTDYPVLGAVPYTNFYCDEQAYPGFFADMETRCQGKPRIKILKVILNLYLSILMIHFNVSLSLL